MPSLLDHHRPHVLAYPLEAVVAEKVEAMVSLGVTNSRMKDFYDVHQLAPSSPFPGQVLVRAIRATFARRETPLPGDDPLVLLPVLRAAASDAAFQQHRDPGRPWQALEDTAFD